MAIRDSQDVSLALKQNPGAIRVSQDASLAIVSNPGVRRVSQDVVLVLKKTAISGTIADSQSAQTLDAAGGVVNTVSTTQAPQSLSASGSLIIKVRDSQDLALALVQNPGTPRDSQDLVLALKQNPGIRRTSQEVILVLASTVWTGAIADTQAPQTLAVAGDAVLRVRRPSPTIQVHPAVKPFDFTSRPLTQAGRRSAIFTTVLTAAGASRAFSMPLGARNRPIAGRVFSFAMGGSLVLGTVGGTLIITPFYGATADGVNLGQSVPYVYAANFARVTQWRLKGEILFQQVDLTPGLSSVICSGVFVMGGDPEIPGSGMTVLFGSSNPIPVDTGSVAPSASGALNFAATFAPFSINAIKPSVSAKYAFLRS